MPSADIRGTASGCKSLGVLVRRNVVSDDDGGLGQPGLPAVISEDDGRVGQLQDWEKVHTVQSL